MASAHLLDALRQREMAYAPLQSVDLIAWHRRQTLYQRDVKGHKGCVNALEFSRDENLLLSGGDDCQVFLWSTSNLIGKANAKPHRIMQREHMSNIFSLGFNYSGTEAYSAGNDRQFLAHDVETGKNTYILRAQRSIHRLDPHPVISGQVAVASEDGNVYIVDTRTKDHTRYPMKNMVYSAMYNPLERDLLCVSVDRQGLQIYDTRQMNEPVVNLKQPGKSCTYARWSPDGTAIAAVLTRGSVMYYRCIDGTETALNDPEFMNSCTMKSCTFIDNETVLCGSDRWDMCQAKAKTAYSYAWKVDASVESVDHCYARLEGHRSIVNHIRYSARNNVIVSSGVEKIIKCWSAFELEGSRRDPPRREPSDPRYGDDYRFDAYDTTEEDLRTLYQFDQYVRGAMDRDHYFRYALDSDSDDSDIDTSNIHVRMLSFDVMQVPSDDDNEDDADEDGEDNDLSELEQEVASDDDVDEDDLNGEATAASNGAHSPTQAAPADSNASAAEAADQSS